MNTSTEGVTLVAVFVNDVLSHYKDKKEEYRELFKLLEGHDLSDPMGQVPMSLYNDVCYWIEDNLGKFSLISAGRRIGETVYETFRTQDMIGDSPTPLEAMTALKTVAGVLIQDPENRGWEILEDNKNSILMRRTQTFNKNLQLGLLDGLMRKCTKAVGCDVKLEKEIESGAEFDEYRIAWLA